jgi:hypothetical protein
MNNEVFATLDKRLKQFEDGVAVSNIFKNEKFILTAIRSLAYTAEDISSLLKRYMIRMNAIAEKSPDTYNYRASRSVILEHKEGIEEPIVHQLDYPEPLTQEEKENDLPKLIEEIMALYHGLKLLLSELEIANNTSALQNPPKQEIHLPENFSLRDLAKNHPSSLTTNQVALLMHYFREAGLFPNYSEADLGRIAEWIFAKSKNTVRQSLGKRDELMEENLGGNLKVLKTYLQEIISQIDADLTYLFR